MGQEKLYATDETFREVADLLYGGGADELISKLTGKQERRQAQIGLATNVLGVGAGAVGTVEAANKLKQIGAAKKAVNYVGRHAGPAVEAVPAHMKVPEVPKIAGRLSHLKGKYALAAAGGALGLQAANLGGDVIANRVLSRAAEKPKKKVAKGYIAKMEPGSSDVSVKSGKLRKLTGHPLGDSVPVGSNKPLKSVAKSFTWEGEFSKVDADKRQVFGWASVIEKDGEPVYDLQGDYIDSDEIEKSAYDYVIKSRKGGDMHRRNEDNTPVHSSDMIESFMVTPEKVAKMGLPEGSLPTGWWVGFQVNDDDAWNLVKSGQRTAFSIHGRGQRTPMEGSNA